jgi:hypothetical protein
MCVAQSVPLPGFLFYYLSISLENWKCVVE